MTNPAPMSMEERVRALKDRVQAQNLKIKVMTGKGNKKRKSLAALNLQIFKDYIALLLELDEKIIQKLLLFIQDAKKHVGNIKISKGVGISVGGVGGALTLVAIGVGVFFPPTFAAAAIWAGVGGVASAAGGLTAIGSDITQTVILNRIGREVMKLRELQEVLGKGIDKTLSKLDAYIEDVQGTGLTKQDAKDYVMEEFRKGELTLVDKELDLVHLNSTRGTTIGNGSTISKNVRSAQIAAVGFGKIVSGTLTGVGIAGIGVKALRCTLQGVGAGLGLIFTTYEAVTYYKNLDTIHPVIEQVEIVVEEYKGEIKRFTELSNFLNSPTS